MKRYLTSILATIAVTCGTCAAQESVGWNYQGVGGVGLTAADEAGAPGFEQDNWNNHTGSGQGSGTVPLDNLLDSSGAATTLDVTAWTVSVANSWQHSQTTTPNEILMNDFNNKQPSLTFEEIPYTANGYSVVVYYGNNEGPSTSTLTVGSQTRTIQTGDIDQSSFGIVGYIEGTDSNSDSSSNYAVFNGLTSANLTISLSTDNNNGISAIQFVEELASDPPAPASNPEPPHLAIDVGVGKTLNWDDANRADMYDIFLWLSSDPKPAAPAATGATSEFTPPADLEVTSEYSWQVVSKNTVSATSTDGPIWTFATGSNLPPDAPVNPMPLVGATLVNPEAALNWDDSSRADTYNVYLWVPPASKPASPTAVTSASTYTPTVALSPATDYSWTVEAINGDGLTPAVDSVWTFSTLGAPAEPPTDPSPTDTEIAVSPITELGWSQVTYASTYEVRLWPSSEARPNEPTTTTASNSYQPAAILSAATAYTWEVEAINSLGSTSGGPWTFTTASSVAGPSQIGWNNVGVGGISLDPAAVAGATGFEQANWNNHSSIAQAPGEPIFDLNNNSGTSTTADIVAWTQSSNNSWQHQQTASPDEILMNDFSNREPAITFAEIPFGSYDVVVYYGNNEGPSTSTLTVGDQTREITTGNTANSSLRSIGFVEGTVDNVVDPSNYAVFYNLSGSELIVSLTGENNNGISAIQLVQTSGETIEVTVIKLVEGVPNITFTSVPDALYRIERSTDLHAAWGEASDDTESTGSLTTFTDSRLSQDLPGATRVFYRISRLE